MLKLVFLSRPDLPQMLLATPNYIYSNQILPIASKQAVISYAFILTIKV